MFLLYIYWKDEFKYLIMRSLDNFRELFSSAENLKCEAVPNPKTRAFISLCMDFKKGALALNQTNDSIKQNIRAIINKSIILSSKIPQIDKFVMSKMFIKDVENLEVIMADDPHIEKSIQLINDRIDFYWQKTIDGIQNFGKYAKDLNTTLENEIE